MKNVKLKLFFVMVAGFVFATPFFASAEIYNVESTITSPNYRPYAGGHTAPIVVFVGAPDKPFQEMGILKASGSKGTTDGEFIDALKAKAAEINVDGIANIQFSVEPGRLVKVNGVLTTTKVRVARATSIIFTN